MTVSPPPGVKLSTASRGSSLALSRDGRRIVFVGQQDGGAPRLYLRELGRFEAVAIEDTEGAANPFFSPDGASVGFFAGGRLKKVSLAGGAPVVLADVLNERGHAWLRDDSIILTPLSNVGLMRLPAAGTGRAEPFTALAEGELSHRWPFQLPDASAVLFSIWNDTGWDFARIAAQRAGSRERVVVLEAGGGYPRYLHDPVSGRGYLVYARAEGLLAARFDASALRLTGAPVPVVDAVVTNQSGGAHFALAGEGTLAYIPGNNAEANRELAWVTREGRRTPAVRVPGAGSFFSLDARAHACFASPPSDRATSGWRISRRAHRRASRAVRCGSRAPGHPTASGWSLRKACRCPISIAFEPVRAVRRNDSRRAATASSR